MTDLYIATPTQADYDALIRLAEAAGYKWCSGSKPTEEHKFHIYECETVVRMREDALLEYCDKPYYEDNQGTKIETIPYLSSIVAIYRTENMDWDEYAKTHPVSGVQPSLMFPCLVERNDGSIYFISNHKPAQALAIEYKPKESEEAMNEKVKLPKRLYDALQDYGLPENGNESWPVGTISGLYDQWREEEPSVLGTFIDENVDNQWKLIDALRYGYEAEPEPRWGIKAGNCYMNDACHNSFTNLIEEGFVFYNKSSAEGRVDMLGFGEVVDLNKEGKDEN